MKKILYIYKITNLLNGKIYVGKHSSVNIENCYMGSGIIIKKAIRKYGIKNFRKDILCICQTEKELNKKEIFWISKTGAFGDGYNLTKGGEGMLGFIPSLEQRKNAVKSRKNYYINNPKMRKFLSEKAKLRIKELNPFYGRKLTKEHIEKMKIARVKAITGSNNPSAVRIHCIEENITFDTAKDAAIFCKLKWSTSILKAAKGQLKKAGGYTWRIV